MAESRRDFIHKISIATKEMRESRGWIRFCAQTRLVSASEVQSLHDEADQLFRMLAKSVSTARKKGHDSAETDVSPEDLG